MRSRELALSLAHRLKLLLSFLPRLNYLITSPSLYPSLLASSKAGERKIAQIDGWCGRRARVVVPCARGLQGNEGLMWGERKRDDGLEEKKDFPNRISIWPLILSLRQSLAFFISFQFESEIDSPLKNDTRVAGVIIVVLLFFFFVFLCCCCFMQVCLLFLVSMSRKVSLPARELMPSLPLLRRLEGKKEERELRNPSRDDRLFLRRKR